MTRRWLLKRLGTVALALGWAAAPASGYADGPGVTLYGALIIASNEEHPAEPPPEIRAEAENLHAVFGYNQFRVIGEKRKPVVLGTEDWLVSSRRFFLRVDTRRPIPGGYALGLQLLREKHPLAEAQVNLKRDAPLFIRGPQTAKGQLIILLTIL